MTAPATSSPPRFQFPRQLVRPAFPSPPNFAAFGDVGARYIVPSFLPVVRENDIGREELKNQRHPYQRESLGRQACNIVIRSFLRPEEIFGRHNRNPDWKVCV